MLVNLAFPYECIAYANTILSFRLVLAAIVLGSDPCLLELIDYFEVYTAVNSFELTN